MLKFVYLLPIPQSQADSEIPVLAFRGGILGELALGRERVKHAENLAYSWEGSAFKVS